jgi:hypothetical protein
MMIARRVLGGLDSAAESSLSDDESEADSKGLIGAPHHCKSIFHLLIATPFNTLHFSSFNNPFFIFLFSNSIIRD